MEYSKITVEISSICNAKCKYCTTGLKNRLGNSEKAHFMTAAEFKKGIETLIAKGCLGKDTELELYNWGEPLLNPNINEIVEIMERKQIHYHLSTNAYDISRFHPKELEYLTALKVSVCGVTPDKYEKIYGLKVDRVKANIHKLYDLLQETAHNQDKLEISFLVYRFNVDEIILAQKEFENIKVIPRLAYFADYYQCQGWLSGTLDSQLAFEADKDLWTELLQDKVEKYEETFQCPQWEILVVDDFWNIIPCCRLTQEESIGNLFDLEASEIIQMKKNVTKCTECIKYKQHWLCNTNNEIYFGYNDTLLEPYINRNKELKIKFENALKSYAQLKDKYKQAIDAYQILKEKYLK